MSGWDARRLDLPEKRAPKIVLTIYRRESLTAVQTSLKASLPGAGCRKPLADVPCREAWMFCALISMDSLEASFLDGAMLLVGSVTFSRAQCPLLGSTVERAGRLSLAAMC